MDIVKTALGVVLGLLCWNFLLVWIEHQEKVEQQKQLDRVIEAAAAECKRTKMIEDCVKEMKLRNTKVEQMVEDFKKSL